MRSKRYLQKTWFKVAVVLFTMAIWVVACPISAKAGEVMTGKLGENDTIFWRYEPDTETLKLTGEGNGSDWRGVKYLNNGEMKHIVLENCKISGNAIDMFSFLENVESITFKNVDTSEVNNMAQMFYGSEKLISLDLSEFDTENVTSMFNMFGRCTNLTSIDVSSFNTSNVTDMRQMFYECSKLQRVDVSGFDTENVTSMFYMFGFCKELKELDVSGFKTGNVTNMSCMFTECLELTELDVSGFDTGKVTTMSNMFSDCSAVTKLDVSGFDTKNVEKMDWMFTRCYGLTNLDVSGFDTEKVTTMRSMFGYCTGLTDLDVSKFNTKNVIDMWAMFSGCSGLTSLDLSGFNTENVTDMSSMFFRCSGLTSLDISGFDMRKVTTMNSMFSNCSNLINLDLSKMDIGNVTDMSHAFYKCGKLTNLNLSNLNLNNVINTIGIFKDTRKIKVIQTPKVIPDNLAIVLPDVYQDEKGNKYTTLTNLNTNIMLKREPSPFADVSEDSWQYEYVKFALNNNLMKGKDTDANGNIIFDPNTEMTRAEFVQTLYNKEGKPEVTYTNKFPDVASGKWYTNAILWAAENNIVAGKGDGNFDVNGKITRQEMATILYKYANYKNYYTAGREELTSYTDASSISNWAVENMKWAIFNDVMKGKGDRLAPLDNATRAECATMLSNFISRYE